jgi:two-component system cell cycle sensor histidine kinase PleC
MLSQKGGQAVQASDSDPDEAAQARLVADAVSEAAAFVDAGRRCRFANRAWRLWFGTTGLPPIDQIADAVDAALAGQPASATIALPGEGEVPRRVLLTASPHLTDDGRLAGALMVARDDGDHARAEVAWHRAYDELERSMEPRTRALSQEVQERRRAERELLAAKEQAELANRAKSEFLANMSHELRTPLNAIIGFASMMEGEIAGPLGHPKYREYAKVIGNSGGHLLAVINDLLDIAKIEAGRFEMHPQPVELRDAVDGAVLFMRERAGQGGVALETEVAGDVPLVLADPVRLKQIFLNLLSNAVKFTPVGGRVSLRAWRDTAGDFVFIEIADTGIGMTPAGIAVALQPFGQVDSDLSTTGSGTGLGLPLVKSFVALHGGSLEIESAVGAGTVVRVRLPAARGAAQQI